MPETTRAEVKVDILFYIEKRQADLMFGKGFDIDLPNKDPLRRIPIKYSEALKLADRTEDNLKDEHREYVTISVNIPHDLAEKTLRNYNQFLAEREASKAIDQELAKK